MTEKILIVDDEPRVARLVSEVLSAVGYKVVAAATGKAAIEKVALEQPDLVLLDILLPQGMDGYQVCAQIREFSDVPVIMLTAKARDIDVLRGFDAGADDYLTKPFNAKELVLGSRQCCGAPIAPRQWSRARWPVASWRSILPVARSLCAASRSL